MPNDYTGLNNDIMKAVDIVAREQTGFIASSSINVNGSERAAKDDTIKSAFTRPAAAADVSPSMTVPEGTNKTVDNKTFTLNKFRDVQLPFEGEEIQHLNNGIGFQTVFGDEIMQAMRTLTNEVESDLWTEAYTNASRAVGVAGTTPFASNHHIVNSARQILVDNGAPMKDKRVSLCMSSSAGTNFRNLTNLYKVNEAGDSSLLRRGVLTDISDIAMRESDAPTVHTSGTGTGYLINGAEAVAQETLTLDTGTGTILAGDVITHADDSDNNYMVNTALSGGDVVIGEPGLRVAASDNAAVTVGADYTPSVMFHQSALELAMRAPKDPIVGGVNLSTAAFSTTIRDPESGLTFMINMYGGFHKGMVQVCALWGVKAWMPKYIVVVMG